MNDLTYSDELTWREHLIRRHANLVEAGWLFVRDLNAGLDKFGRGDWKRRELLEQIAADLNVTVKHLTSMANMFKSPVAAIATELNLEHDAKLTISHAMAVHGLETDVARDILTTAAEQGWSVEQVKAKAWGTRHLPVDMLGNSTPPQQTELPAPYHRDAIDLETQIRDVTHKRLTLTNAAVLPVIMRTEERIALAMYAKVSKDAPDWWLADQCLQVQKQAQHMRDLYKWPYTKYINYYTAQRAEVCDLYNIEASDFESHAETARLWPQEQRRQNETLTYRHHFLLRNRTEDREYYLQRATVDGWTAERLAEELKGQVK